MARTVSLKVSQQRACAFCVCVVVFFSGGGGSYYYCFLPLPTRIRSCFARSCCCGGGVSGGEVGDGGDGDGAGCLYFHIHLPVCL